jgi:predicted DNA-binding transcriptional regulator YafY
MARGDQLGRQWRIIQTLLISRTGQSAADLAEEMEANPRTVYRDLEALQVAGFPIYTDRVDGKNLWSLLDTMKHHIPIPFNLMELMALYFSRDMMKVFKDTVFYDNLESLFNKIKTTLPKESLNFRRNEFVSFYYFFPHNSEVFRNINETGISPKQPLFQGKNSISWKCAGSLPLICWGLSFLKRRPKPF